MIRCLALAAFLLVSHAVAQTAKVVDIRKSLVRITTTSQEPDYKVPWNPGSISGGVAAGFIVEGERILTKAHCGRNARFIVVHAGDDPQRHSPAVPVVVVDWRLDSPPV